MKRKHAVPRRKFSLRKYARSVAVLVPVILTGSIGGLGVMRAALTWSGSVDSFWDTTTANWLSGATPALYTDGQDVTFGATASQFNVNILTAPGDSLGGFGVSPNSVTVTDNAGQNYTIGGDPINGSGALTKTGLGTLTLTGNNSFSGAILIKQGAVNVSSFDGAFGNGNLGDGVGAITLGDASLNSTGTLNFTGNSAQFLLNSMAIAGTGGIIATDQQLSIAGVLSGASTLTVTGVTTGGGQLSYSNTANTFTGSFVLNQGTITVGSMGLAGNGQGKTITLPSGGVAAGYFEYGGSNLGTLTAPDFRTILVPAAGGQIYVDSPTTTWFVQGLTDTANPAGNGLVMNGAGTLIITGAVNLKNYPVIASGTLGFSNVANVFPTSGGFLVQSGGTLLTYPGAIGTVSTASFSLNGGSLALVGTANATSTTFGYNVPVAGAGSGVGFTNPAFTPTAAVPIPEAKMGNLDLQANFVNNGGNLNVNAGRLTFASTSFDPATQTSYTINSAPSSDISLGSINDFGNAIQIAKTGNGTLSFDNPAATSVANFKAGDTVDIQQGNLNVVASTTVNPLSTATIMFDDNGRGAGTGNTPATLVLGTSAASGTVTFNNQILINSNAAIKAANLNGTAFGGGTSGFDTLALGATVFPTLNVPQGNVLTLSSADSTNFYILTIARTITGGGDVTVVNPPGNSSAVNLTGTLGNVIGNFISTGGTTTITGGTTTMQTLSTFTGGVVNLGGTANLAPAVTTVNAGITLNGGTINIKGATNSSSTLNSPAGITLTQGGIINFTPSTSGANYTGGTISVNSVATSPLSQVNTVGAGTTNLNGATIAILPAGNYATFDQLTEKFYSGANPGGALTPGNANFLPNKAATATDLLTNAAVPTGLSFLTDAALAARASNNTANFEMSWSGFVNLPAGTYTFGTQSDDGSAIFIDTNNNGIYETGEEVVNNDFSQGVTARTGTVTIGTAGNYPIFIGYYQGTGDQAMEAAFAPAGGLAYSNLNVILSSVGQGFSTLAPGGGGNVSVAGTLMAGAITGASTITIAAAGTLNLTNTSGTSSTSILNISGATAALNLTAGQNFTVNNLNLTGGGILTKTGGGSLTITGAPTAGLNGSVIFNGIYAPASPAILDLQAGGALVAGAATAPALMLNNSELVLDDSISTNLGNRLGNSTLSGSKVTMNGGFIQFTASATAGANSTENMGTLTLGSGGNQINVSNVTSGTVKLNSASLTRQNNATVAFSANTLGGSLALADDIIFTTAPVLSGGGGAAGSQTLSILPYAIGRNTAGASTQWGLVTYDSNGVRALRTTEYSTLASAAGTTSNARDVITANAMSITGNTVNAYVLDDTLTSGVTPTVTLSGTLTPVSGELVFASTSTKPGAITLTGGTIDFATAEGIIQVTNPLGTEIDSVIANTGGSAGLTVGGLGPLTLTNAANSFTGPVTINGTTLAITSDAALGVSTNPINLAGGTNNGGGFLKFGASNITLNASRIVTIAANSFGGFDTGPFSDTVAAQISGSGTFVKIGNGNLTLANTANNYTGPTQIAAGTLTATTATLPANAVLDSGALVFNQPALSGTFSAVISGPGSVTATASGQTVSLGGTASGDFDPTNSTAGANTYTGGTTVSAGTTLQGTTTSLQGAIVGSGLGPAVAINQTFAGVLRATISGTASLTLLSTGAQTGNLTINSPQTYSGATTISSGRLILQNLTASTTSDTLGATAITVASGAILEPNVVAASQTTNVNIGPVSGVSHASITLLPGVTAGSGAILDLTDNTAGAIISPETTLKTFSINPGSTFNGTSLTIGAVLSSGFAPVINFGLGMGASDTIVVQGSVATAGTGGVINIVPLASDTSLVPGSYPLITASTSGELGNALLTLKSTSLAVGGIAYTLDLRQSSGFSEVLNVTQVATPASAYWDGSLSGSWSGINIDPTTSAITTNWSTSLAGTTDTHQVPMGATNVFFTTNGGTPATNLTTTLGGNFEINSLNFTGNGSATNPVTIASGTSTTGTVFSLTLDAASGVGITDADGNGPVTISAPIVLGNDQRWSNNSTSGTLLTVSGQISGPYSLTTTGTGTIVLSAVNTYSGGMTSVQSGTLKAGIANTLPQTGQGTILTLGAGASSGAFDLGGFNQTIAGLTTAGSGSANIITNTGAANATLTVNNDSNTTGTDFTFGGIIQDGTKTVALVKTGSNALTLTGPNTFSGGLTVNGGTLSVAMDANLGAATGAVTIGAGSLQTTSSFASARAINLTNGASTIDVEAGSLTLSHALAGVGGLNVMSSGFTPGTLVLTVASTYGGPTDILSGTLKAGITNALPQAVAGTTLTLGSALTNSSGNFDLGGFNQSVAGLATADSPAADVITNSGATSAVLTVNNDTVTSNASFVFGGTIKDGNAKTGLTKTGAKTLTLTGSNTYSGPTTVSAGRLVLQNLNGANVLGATAITVAPGAAFAPNYNIDSPSATIGIGPASGSNGATLTLSPGTGVNAGALFDMTDGTGTIKTFTINQGTSFAGTALTIGGTGSAANAPQLNFEIGASAGQIDNIAATGLVTVGASGGLLNIVALPTDTSLAVGNYTLITGSTGSNLGTVGLVLKSTALAVDGIAYTLSLAPSTATQEILSVSQIAASGTLYWDGRQDGNWNTINAGNATNWSSSPTAIVDANQAPTPTTNVTFTVNAPPNAGELANTLGRDFTINSLAFTGTGTSATNPVSISGNNLTINALAVGGNAAGNGITVFSGNGGVTINSNVILGTSQTWTNNSSVPLTVNGVIGDNGTGNGLATAGTGTVVLTAFNTYTGPTNVSSGRLVLQNEAFDPSQNTLASGMITVAPGAALAPNNALPFSSSIGVGPVAGSGTGSTVILSPGTGASGGALLDFTDNSGANKTFTINQGTNFTGTALQIGGDGSAANAPQMNITIGVGIGAIDNIVAVGKVTVGATGGIVNIVPIVGDTNLVPGSYPFISGSAGSNLGPNALTLSSPTIGVGGIAYTLSLSPSTATQETLLVAQVAAPVNAYWDGAQSAIWSTINAGNATNWSTNPNAIADPHQNPMGTTNVFFTVNNPPGAANLNTTLGVDTTINSLTFTGVGASGSSPVTIGGANTLTINALAGGGNLAGNGLTVQPGRGAVTLSSNVILGTSQTWTNNSTQPLTISGQVADGGAGLNLTLAGTGTIIFSGSAIYSGTTTVTAAKLVLQNLNSNPLNTTFNTGNATVATTPITVSGASIFAPNNSAASPTTTIGIGPGFGTFGVNLILSPGAGTTGTVLDLTDSTNTIKTFNINQGTTYTGTSLTIGAGASIVTAPQLNFDLGATAGLIDLIAVTGGVSVGQGVINIVPLPADASLTAGNYTFMTASSGLASSGLTLKNSSLILNGVGYSLALTASNATSEILTVGLVPTVYWDGAQSAAWNLTGTTNWSSSPSAVTPTTIPTAVNNVTFMTTAGKNLSTTLGQNFTINSLIFNSTASQPVTIASGGSFSLTLNGGIAVQTGSGAHTISAPVILGTNQTWTNSSANPLTVSGGISGSGKSLTTAGTGTIIIAGASTYTGATNINAGTLAVAVGGSISGSSINIAAAAKFDVSALPAAFAVGASGAQTLTGGAGTSAGNVLGALTVNGASTIAPGAPGARNTGILALNNNFTLSSGAHLTLDLNGTVAGTNYDQVQANGTVTLAGDLSGLALGYTPAQGDVFYIILNNGATTTGSLNNLAEGGVFNLGVTAFKISYDSSHGLGAAGFESGTGADVALMVVPEPTTVATFLGGIGTLVGLQRFRRRRA